MKKCIWFAPIIASLFVLCGCSTAVPVQTSANFCPVAEPASQEVIAQSDRMISWEASFAIDVWDVSNAVAQTCSMVEKLGGFVDSKSSIGTSSASLTIKVPAKAFTGAISDLESLGDVTYRDVSSEDVTEKSIDVDARLKNKIILRDRLKQLLEKAVDVKDVLAIETELNRVQSDIDSMEGCIKSLKGRVEYASIDLDIDRKPVLGPLGYVFKGAGWCLKKLFIMRD